MSDLWEKEYLTKDDIAECLKTKEGRRERVTHGLAHVFAHLGIMPPSAEKQEEICAIMWDTLFRKPVWELLEEKELAQSCKEAGVKPVCMDELYHMRVRGEA
jgi:hypothetical protein